MWDKIIIAKINWAPNMTYIFLAKYMHVYIQYYIFMNILYMHIYTCV